MGRFSIRVFAVIGIIGVGLTTGATAANAADPSDPFGEVCNKKSGCVSGVVSWSNRSAAISVNLFDDRNDGSTTVVADCYTDSDIYIPHRTDTRTANNERIKRVLSCEGPEGGIVVVDITLVANVNGAKTAVTTEYRRK